MTSSAQALQQIENVIGELASAKSHAAASELLGRLLDIRGGDQEVNAALDRATDAFQEAYLRITAETSEQVVIEGVLYQVQRRVTPESEEAAGHANIARILRTDDAHLLYLKRGKGRRLYQVKEFHHPLGSYYGKVLSLGIDA